MKKPAYFFPCFLIALGLGCLSTSPAAAQGYGEPLYGYHPQVVPPPPGVVMGSGEQRFFLDRFGRRFKIYRARPYQPGEDASLPPAGLEIPVVPPANPAAPVEILRNSTGEAGQIERARPYVPGGDRYPLAASGDPERIPDLSRYPKPPENWGKKGDGLLRRTPVELTPVPKENLPAPQNGPGTNPPNTAAPEVPNPWSRPSLPPQQGTASGEGSTLAPNEPSASTEPPSRAAASQDQFAGLPYGVPVKGKKGFVTLEAHPSLPEIDVRGIAPGTPVEFPDPRDPSQIIQFRVPKFE